MDETARGCLAGDKVLAESHPVRGYKDATYVHSCLSHKRPGYSSQRGMTTGAGEPGFCYSPGITCDIAYWLR